MKLTKKQVQQLQEAVDVIQEVHGAAMCQEFPTGMKFSLTDDPKAFFKIVKHMVPYSVAVDETGRVRREFEHGWFYYRPLNKRGQVYGETRIMPVGTFYRYCKKVGD